MSAAQTQNAAMDISTSLPTNAPFVVGDPHEIISDNEIPFTRFQLPPEEETLETVHTVQAWVVDIPDPRNTATMLKWLKQSGLDSTKLGHLKRIRKLGDITTLLLSTSSAPPVLPDDFDLPVPYLLTVPVSAALTLPSWTVKFSLWPTIYAPRRKGELEGWSRGKVQWACEAMKLAAETAIKAQANGELPIAALVPVSYESTDDVPGLIPFIACDTRKSTTHPLRHAVINVIRQLADYHAQLISTEVSSPDTEDSRNGTNYLLTSLTLFTTHEPCIMCSMALLHSRVKEVIYMIPMAKTGGCGGLACLPTLEGVNHRFGICRWNDNHDEFYAQRLQLDTSIDA